MSSLYENVPRELQELDQWVCRDRMKIPMIAGTSRRASSTNPKTWRSFYECVQAAEAYPSLYAGIGFVFTKSDPYAGLDLDDVRDPETGTLAPQAAVTVARLDSYAEVSPSGTGVKVFVRARLDRANKKPGVEVYPHGRYFTVTGRMLARSRPVVEERQTHIEEIIREEFPEPEREPVRPYSGPPGEKTDLSELLMLGGVRVVREIPDGTAERVYGIVCPWAHEHSGGDTSGTRVGQYADGALFFRCEHAHCALRGWTEFREFVRPAEVARFRRGKTYARRKGAVSVG
ncbi:MAG: hypothetical protein M3426_12360 [Actinomycetota bacterium]|nr:hypothetical protein [Actinomycetota bacterium]